MIIRTLMQKSIFTLLLVAFFTNVYASQPGVPTPEDCYPQDICRPMWSDSRKLIYPPQQRDMSRYSETRVISWACEKWGHAYVPAGGYAHDLNERCLTAGFDYYAGEKVGPCVRGSLGIFSAQVTYTCVSGGR